MKNFDEEIKKIAEHFNREPIFDGVIDEDKYLKSETKILWILKDPNSSGENGSWNMREHIKSKLKTKKGILKGWSTTFKKIIYVTNGILNNLEWNDELLHPTTEPYVIDELQKVAYINIKKTGGGSNSLDNELKEYYDFSKEILFQQIEEFSPDIIIFGGTFKFFSEDLNLGKLVDFGSCYAIKKNNRIYIDSKHPAYFSLKEEKYFNDILKAVNQLK